MSICGPTAMVSGYAAGYMGFAPWHPCTTVLVVLSPPSAHRLPFTTFTFTTFTTHGYDITVARRGYHTTPLV
jgi:hypothetical protein